MQRPAFSVALTGITRPVPRRAGSAVTPADLLAHHARVSSTNQDRPETGPKLLASCARRGEWSVFEMVSVTFEVQTTRDIARQMLRHRSFSFQEFSQRYAVVTDKVPPREARMKNPDDRQKPLPCDDTHTERGWLAAQNIVRACADANYRWALNNGIAPEVARAVLPEGLTPSTLYMAGTVRSWIHYLRQRCAPETQQEHRLIAEEIRRQLMAELPELEGILHPVTELRVPDFTDEEIAELQTAFGTAGARKILANEDRRVPREVYAQMFDPPELAKRRPTLLRQEDVDRALGTPFCACRRADTPADYDFRTRLTDDAYGAGFVG